MGPGGRCKTAFRIADNKVVAFLPDSRIKEAKSNGAGAGRCCNMGCPIGGCSRFFSLSAESSSGCNGGSSSSLESLKPGNVHNIPKCPGHHDDKWDKLGYPNLSQLILMVQVPRAYLDIPTYPDSPSSQMVPKLMVEYTTPKLFMVYTRCMKVICHCLIFLEYNFYRESTRYIPYYFCYSYYLFILIMQESANWNQLAIRLFASSTTSQHVPPLLRDSEV